MKHAIIFYFFIICIGLHSSAQVNLVPNPSFEDTVMCPDAGAQVYRATHWYIAEQTPDYFNSCCIYPQYCVPQNFFDYQLAATGNAYCGFYTYSTVDTNYREKIGVQLINPLIIGIKYFVSFKLSATKKYLNGACNKIGALFSTIQYTTINLSPTNNFCQIWVDSIVDDTMNWTRVNGSFIADSSYLFLTLGNFYLNSSTDTSSFWHINALQAYYYIDDVCVSIDSNLCKQIELNEDENINTNSLTVYPNPASLNIRIKSNLNSSSIFELVNIEGKIINTKIIELGISEWVEDISELSNGIYILKLISSTKTYENKLFIYH